VTETTTIEITITNRDKLHSIADSLQKILRKRHVSLDEALAVLLTVKSLDVVLQDMILGEAEMH
jgi:2-hydroxy-3-keto-5-methylthiopentenyl-1-phosphate phosphatase